MKKVYLTAIIRIIIVLFLISLTADCGGGSGSDDIIDTADVPDHPVQMTPVSIPGTIELPEGLLLTPESLRIRTARGVSHVSQDGSFNALGFEEGPLLMVAETISGEPVLFGWTGDERPMSVRTTSEVILFYALGFFSLPPDACNDAINALKATEEIDELGKVIASEIKSNPGAFSMGRNDNMADALNSLISLFNAQKMMSSHSPEIDNKSGIKVTVSGSGNYNVPVHEQNLSFTSGITNAVLVNPPEEQSGITANIASGLNCIELSNRFIRPAYAYLEQTGYRLADGQQEIEDFRKILEFDIAPVKMFNGTIATLWDLLSNQNLAFAEVTTGPFTLPMAAGADRTHFRLTVIGPGTGEGHAMTAAQTKKYEELSLEYMLTYVAIPFIANCLVPQSPLSQYKVAKLLTANNVLQDILSIINSTVPDVGTAIENHDLSAAMTALMSAIATNNSFRQALLEVITKAVGQDMFPSAATMASRLSSAITVVDAIGTLVSGVMSTGNVYLAYPCNVWELDATIPRVTLSPEEQDVAKEEYCWLEAHVPDLSESLPSGAVVHYRWSTSGSFGKLVNPDTGQSDNSFETTYSKVSYLADKQEGTDTISVEAVLVQGTLSESLGTATASVHVIAMRKCENRAYHFKYDIQQPSGEWEYRYIYIVIYVWRMVPDVNCYGIYPEGEYWKDICTDMLMTKANSFPEFNLADDELAIGGSAVAGTSESPELRDVLYEADSELGQQKISEGMSKSMYVVP